MTPERLAIAYLLAGALLVLQASVRGSFRVDVREPEGWCVTLGALLLWPVIVGLELAELLLRRKR